MRGGRGGKGEGVKVANFEPENSFVRRARKKWGKAYKSRVAKTQYHFQRSLTKEKLGPGGDATGAHHDHPGEWAPWRCRHHVVVFVVQVPITVEVVGDGGALHPKLEQWQHIEVECPGHNVRALDGGRVVDHVSNSVTVLERRERGAVGSHRRAEVPNRPGVPVEKGAVISGQRLVVLAPGRPGVPRRSCAKRRREGYSEEKRDRQRQKEREGGRKEERKRAKEG